ncbi:MAG: hypothetical protein JJE09_09120 [Bacteroidia bacterium]|nr:hypothetical protein [Bacteroidia bacterium]
MVEVFKTNVINQEQAHMLANEINKQFNYYTASFDLEDCDNILRITCTSGIVDSGRVINLLNNFGCDAMVLSDDVHFKDTRSEPSLTLN